MWTAISYNNIFYHPDYGTGKSSVDMPDDASQDLLQDVLEEDDESMIEYVDGDEVAEITEDGGGGTHHQHYVEEEEEYSEEDTIIEEGYWRYVELLVAEDKKCCEDRVARERERDLGWWGRNVVVSYVMNVWLVFY